MRSGAAARRTPGRGGGPIAATPIVHEYFVQSWWSKKLFASRALAGAATPARTDRARSAERIVFMATPPMLGAVGVKESSPSAPIPLPLRFLSLFPASEVAS